MSKPVIIVDSESKAAILRIHFAGACEVLPVTGVPAVASWRIPRDKLKRGRPRFSFAPSSAAAPFWSRLTPLLERDIYLAFDNNVAGEYWSWLISGAIANVRPGGKIPGRLRLSGYSREELDRAFRLVDITHEEPVVHYHLRLMLNSFLGRHFDRLLGCRHGPGDLPLDFCSLALISLIREREAEIRAHLPAVKWQIGVNLAAEKGSFPARLRYAYGISDNGYFPQAVETKRAIEVFQNEPVVVKAVHRREIRLEPPRPYLWPELLTEAVLLHGFKPLQVINGLEELYCGVDSGTSREGLISSFWALEPISLDPLAEKIGRLLSKSGEREDLEKGGQILEAGCLMPLRPEVPPERLPAEMAPEVRTIYGMIRDRAMAGQMAPAILETAEVELKAGDKCLFGTTLRRAIFPGFLEVYRGIHEQGLLGPSPLDGLREGKQFALARIIPESTHGRPPEPYTLSGLIGDLGMYGLEADPVVISRVAGMLENGYLALLPEGDLRSGENAARAAGIMKRALPSLAGLQLPALMEQLCQEIETGRKPLDFGLQQFEQTLIMQGNVLVKTENVSQGRRRAGTRSSIIKADSGDDARQEREQGGSDCPGPKSIRVSLQEGVPDPGGGKEERQTPAKPSGDLSIPVPSSAGPEQAERSAKPGQADQDRKREQEKMAEAPAAVTLPDQSGAFTASGRPCPVCGQPLLEKEDRHGRYLACSGFPLCRHAESFQKEEEVVTCPLCRRGGILVKRSGSGRTLYVCPEDDCEFLSWNPPRARACPACGGEYLLEMEGAAGQAVLLCPRPECGHRQAPVDGERRKPADAPGVTKLRRVVRRVGAAPGGKRKVVVVRRKK